MSFTSDKLHLHCSLSSIECIICRAKPEEPDLATHPVLNAIGSKYNKTAAQVSISYLPVCLSASLSVVAQIMILNETQLFVSNCTVNTTHTMAMGHKNVGMYNCIFDCHYG